MRTSLITEREHWIRQQLKQVDTNGLKPDVIVVWHHRPFEAMIKTAIEHQHDLIVKGTRKHDKLASVIFTPTDWHLLRKAPCPVLLVKDHAWPTHGKIIAAVNSASTEDTHKALNDKLLKAAKGMCKQLDAELHVLNCYPPPPLNMALEIPEFDTGNYQQAIEEHHRQALHTLCKAHNIAEDKAHVREGLADDEVAALASEIDAELVVLGTIGRTGLTAALLGNTAEHVIETIQCDLLAIKPDGFVSPLAED